MHPLIPRTFLHLSEDPLLVEFWPGRRAIPGDVYWAETPDGFELTAVLPGFDPEQVELQVSDRDLSITLDQSDSPHNLRTTWSYAHRFAGLVDPERVSAELARGLLSVHLPKAAVAPSRRIPISRPQELANPVSPDSSSLEPGSAEPPAEPTPTVESTGEGPAS